VVSERGRWPLVVAFVAAALIATIVGASVVKVPYFALRPGSVLDSSAAIEVDGAPTYPSEGTIHYTTVSIRQTTALEWVMANFDDDVELRARDEILGNRDPEENRQYNQVLMDNSQLAATAAALETLGYEVETSVGGMVVAEVMADYPAEDVLNVGDVIVEVNGEPLDDVDALEAVMADQAPDDAVELMVVPGEDLSDEELSGEAELQAEPEERTVGLAEDPEDEERAIMGIQIAAYDLDYDFPVDVSFDTGEIGGPSAGLAFTLTLIDLMTPGDLTGGQNIAVTGSVFRDGTVGSVGGTGQKAAAARKEDMDAFLVPAAGSDYDNTRSHAGDVEVIPVETVAEALEVLADLGGDPVDLPVEDAA
jgi:PDZ domain-containing protein